MRCHITSTHSAGSLKATTQGELLIELGADFCLLSMPRDFYTQNLERPRVFASSSAILDSATLAETASRDGPVKDRKKPFSSGLKAMVRLRFQSAICLLRKRSFNVRVQRPCICQSHAVIAKAVEAPHAPLHYWPSRASHRAPALCLSTTPKVS